MTLEIRPAREDDLDRILAIVGQAFNVPPAARARYRDNSIDWRVAEDRTGIAGALRVTKAAQFWGGRSIPMAAISSVGVAPQARGRRVAEALMSEVLREARSAGMPISSLYPATVPLYRRCGYGYSATRVSYQADLRVLPRGSDLEPEPWPDDATPDVAIAHRLATTDENGPIDRTDAWWNWLLAVKDDQERYRFLVREGDEVTGAIAYDQVPRPERQWSYDLVAIHLSSTTPAAARALLSLAARHRSLGERLRWWGSPAEPMAWLMEELDAETRGSFRLMTRLADVAAAFEARGWPAQVEASIEIDVRDDIVAENAGGWRIEFVDGRAKAARATASAQAARTDAATLASIWSGMLGARAAARLGLIEGPDETLRTLDGLTAGPAPWISEMF